jgi:hypothetical protein
LRRYNKAEANAVLELNIGEFSVPHLTVEMVLYCGVDGSATEPLFELKVGRCRLPASKPILKARPVLAISA